MKKFSLFGLLSQQILVSLVLTNLEQVGNSLNVNYWLCLIMHGFIWLHFCLNLILVATCSPDWENEKIVKFFLEKQKRISEKQKKNLGETKKESRRNNIESWNLEQVMKEKIVLTESKFKLAWLERKVKIICTIPHV